MSSVLAASPGERLRTLRELLGLTQVQIAAMSGVAASWISDVENGHRDHDEARLKQIAEGTETPVGFFYVQPKVVPLDSLRFRKLASAKRSVTKRLHAFYGESFRICDELIKSRCYPTPPLPYAEVNDLSKDEIEDLAAQTRVALRLAPDKPIPHLTRALERGGIAVAPMVLPYPEGGESTSSDHFGVSYWSGVGETALIGYFPSATGDRDRFTLAHEVGHLVLHTFRPRAENAEAEANLFASALLMPFERAQEELSERTNLTEYARKKANWGISIQALILRAASVGMISETRKRSLYVQLSQKGWRKQEPVEVGKEEPLLLWKLLEQQFGAKPYLPGAEHLAIPPAVLRSIAPSPKVYSKRKPLERDMGERAGNVVKLKAHDAPRTDTPNNRLTGSE